METFAAVEVKSNMIWGLFKRLLLVVCASRSFTKNNMINFGKFLCYVIQRIYWVLAIILSIKIVSVIVRYNLHIRVTTFRKSLPPFPNVWSNRKQFSLFNHIKQASLHTLYENGVLACCHVWLTEISLGIQVDICLLVLPRSEERGLTCTDVFYWSGHFLCSKVADLLVNRPLLLFKSVRFTGMHN